MKSIILASISIFAATHAIGSEPKLIEIAEPDASAYVSIDDPRAASVVVARLEKVPTAGNASFNAKTLLVPIDAGLSGLPRSEAELKRAAAVMEQAAELPAGPLRIRVKKTVKVTAPASPGYPFAAEPIFDAQKGSGSSVVEFVLSRAPAAKAVDGKIIFKLERPKAAEGVGQGVLSAVVTTNGRIGLPQTIRIAKPAKEMPPTLEAEYFFVAAGLYQENRSDKESIPALEVVRVIYRDGAGVVVADEKFAHTFQVPTPSWVKATAG